MLGTQTVNCLTFSTKVNNWSSDWMTFGPGLTCGWEFSNNTTWLSSCHARNKKTRELKNIKN